MTQTTAKGLPYPESSDHTRLWEHIQNLAAAVDALFGGWTSWTPTWTTSTGANLPSFGNATFDCQYAVIGKTVLGRMDIAFGSTTNFGGGSGSDNWVFTVPVAAAGSSGSIGFWEANDSSVSGTRVVGRGRLNASGNFSVEISTGEPSAFAVGNSGLMDSVSPWPWGSGDWLKGTFTYPAA